MQVGGILALLVAHAHGWQSGAANAINNETGMETYCTKPKQYVRGWT
jgi:hypothetical protein